MKYLILTLFSIVAIACGKTVKERDLLQNFRSPDSGDFLKQEPEEEKELDLDQVREEQCKELGFKWENDQCIATDDQSELKEQCLKLGHKWENNKCIKGPEIKVNHLPLFISTPVTDHAYYPPSGDTILLQSQVRDFTISHPDFENYNNDTLALGLVAPILGADGNPIFTGVPGQHVTNLQTFSQWYNDVPGVNQKIMVNLELKKVVGTKVYQYANAQFFPIDNQGFGNENNIHNYHFTLEVATTFTYKGGEVFTFTGDDDVWVFIDNRMAVDLGGVHQELSKSVALDTLGLQVGKDYPFVMFFAERHTTASRFKIESSIQLKTNKPYVYEAKAIDPDNEALVYSLEKAPPGMKIDATTGKIEWLPSQTAVGEHAITVKATDASGGSTTQDYKLKVAAQ